MCLSTQKPPKAMKLLRGIAKQFCPPVIRTIQSKFSKTLVAWSDPLTSWEAAAALCHGYDSDEIFNRVTEATQAVFDGKALYERDSVLFQEIEYSWPLLSSLMTVRAAKGKLHVVDFGGALGSSYFQNKRFLDEISNVHWTVVEQKQFVDIGTKRFQGNILRFAETLASASSLEPIDVVLFGSSLCYLPSPMEILSNTEELRIPYLIFDRTPFITGPKNLYSAQFVREPIYTASYPCQLFSEALFSERLDPTWRKIEAWTSDIQPSQKFTSKGGFYALR